MSKGDDGGIMEIRWKVHRLYKCVMKLYLVIRYSRNLDLRVLCSDLEKLRGDIDEIIDSAHEISDDGV